MFEILKAAGGKNTIQVTMKSITLILLSIALLLPEAHYYFKAAGVSNQLILCVLNDLIHYKRGGEG